MCFPPDQSYSVAGGDIEVAATGPARIDLKAVKAEPPPSEPGFRIRGLILPLVIAIVDPTGPAKAAGLAPGDKLLTIDGVSTAGLLPSGAMMLAFNKRPGTTLTLGIERNGAPLTVKIAVEKIFGVKVTAVNTINRKGKVRRTRNGVGKRKDTKRAIVSVAVGQSIDIFSAPNV